MKIRSAVPENGCLVFLWRTKKNKKTSVKHIRIRLIGGCVNERVPELRQRSHIYQTATYVDADALTCVVIRRRTATHGSVHVAVRCRTSKCLGASVTRLCCTFMAKIVCVKVRWKVRSLSILTVLLSRTWASRTRTRTRTYTGINTHMVLYVQYEKQHI